MRDSTGFEEDSSPCPVRHKKSEFSPTAHISASERVQLPEWTWQLSAISVRKALRRNQRSAPAAARFLLTSTPFNPAGAQCAFTAIAAPIPAA